MAKQQLSRESSAQLAELRRILARLYAIGTALLRTDAISDALSPLAVELATGRKDKDSLADAVPGAVRTLQQTPLLRAGNLLSVHFSLLYAAVEAWQRWHFADARVDELLRDPYVGRLRDFRNAVFHVSVATDARLQRWAGESGPVQWARKVELALRAAVLDWQEHLAERIHQHPRVRQR